jgi:hypothetical protein
VFPGRRETFRRLVFFFFFFFFEKSEEYQRESPFE